MLTFPSSPRQEGNEDVSIRKTSGVHITSAWPSGEIPILLGFDLELDIQTATAEQDTISQSLSTTSVQTAGTFGPTHKNLGRCTTAFEPTGLTADNSCVPYFDAVFEAPSVLPLGTKGAYYDDEEYAGESKIAALRFTLSEYLGPDSELTTNPTISSSPNSPFFASRCLDYYSMYQPSRSPSNLPREALCVPMDIDCDEEVLECSTSYHTISTLPSPIFAPPSPSPSGSFPITPSNSVSLWKKLSSPVKNLFATTRESPLQSPSRLSVVSSTDFIFPISAPCSPETTTAPIHIHRRQRVTSTTTISSIASGPPPSISTAVVPLSLRSEYLPDRLSWLRDINIQLCIGQEGFRAIEVTFRLVGWSELARSLDPFERDGNDPDIASFHAGIVDFMPATRQIFKFHRSTLDSPPMLRRISANGDETRDYISRHASLTLKNGVYTVRGIEASCLSSLALDPDNDMLEFDAVTKWKWKLEYIVQDRKADTTGKVLAAEKTLTLLTFSCSPFLLHPLQGKKIRLMRIFKKNVVARILAEKLEPPKPPNLHKAEVLYQEPLSQINRSLSPIFVHSAHVKKNSWSIHKRAHSHAVDENSDPSMPSAFKQVVQVERQASSRPLRRRRTSSAGEQFHVDRVAEERCVDRLLPGAQSILPRG